MYNMLNEENKCTWLKLGLSGVMVSKLDLYRCWWLDACWYRKSREAYLVARDYYSSADIGCVLHLYSLLNREFLLIQAIVAFFKCVIHNCMYVSISILVKTMWKWWLWVVPWVVLMTSAYLTTEKFIWLVSSEILVTLVYLMTRKFVWLILERY
jgi:hypothetical protein